MLPLPATLSEHIAGFLGSMVGYAQSPRIIVFSMVIFVIGLFRLSVAWALIVGGVAGVSHLYLLQEVGRLNAFSAEYREHFIQMTTLAVILLALVAYFLGRLLRAIKLPIMAVSPHGTPECGRVARAVVEGRSVLQPNRSDISGLASSSNLMEPHRDYGTFVKMIGGGIVLFLVIGFGVQVYAVPEPETPVLYGYVKQPGRGFVWRYATLECVKEGRSLEGYVWDRAAIMDPVNPFDLQPDISLGSLGMARDLARRMPRLRDADPVCMEAEGFMGRRKSLIGSFLS